MVDRPWTEAPLCAFDLEGTGARDKDNEAILEVATIPIVDGSPDMQAAYFADRAEIQNGAYRFR